MKPVDFRNTTFADLQHALAGQRAAVLGAYMKHGPCTTAELAKRSGISILNVRPRTTDLVQLGFVRLADDQPEKGQGVYCSRTPAEHRDWFQQQQSDATQPQLALF